MLFTKAAMETGGKAYKKHGLLPDSVIRSMSVSLHIDEPYAAYLFSVATTLVITAVLCVLLAPLAALASALRAAAPAAPEDRWLQSTWIFVTQSPWLAPIVTSPLFPGLVGIVYYMVSSMPLAVLDVLDLDWVNRRFKLQADKPGGWAQEGAWKTALGTTAYHHVFYIAPGLMAQFIMQGPWLYSQPQCLFDCTGRDLFPEAAPFVLEVVVHVFVCLLVMDSAYHFWHRQHHLSALLYKYVHSVHHQFHVPFVWCTQYVHWGELVAVSVFSTTVPIALGCHPFTTWIWTMTVTQVSIESHSGYDFICTNKLVPFWGGPVHHDNHHKYPRTNFQPFFTWYDWFFQTHCDVSPYGLKAATRK